MVPVDSSKNKRPLALPRMLSMSEGSKPAPDNSRMILSRVGAFLPVGNLRVAVLPGATFCKLVARSLKLMVASLVG